MTVADGIVRVDRRGYSGSIHAARRVADGLRTLCGKRAEGTAWHLSAGVFDAAHIECKLCVRALNGPDRDTDEGLRTAVRA